MKNYRFPSHASRMNGLFNKLSGMRAGLILAFVAALSCLPFYVFAQDGSAPVKTRPSANYRVYGDSPAFVIVMGPNGQTVCRQATVDEARAMRLGGTQELHQINHLKTDAGAANQVESTTAGLTIILRATAQLEANQTAKQAFIAAAAKWEALIKDPITINIDVDFGTTFFGTAFQGPTVLGQTESQLLYSPGNFPDLRQRLNNHATGSEGSLYAALPASSVPTDMGAVNTVVLATPLMRALGLLPAVANDSEQGQIGPAPRIGFNSAFGFDFDPSNGITSNQTDFDAVAVHEMGHVLGFNSLVGDAELSPGLSGVSIWDIFRFRPGTANLNTFNSAQRILTSDNLAQVHFSGGPELGLSTGKPVQPIGGDGNQASHWKADEQSGLYIGIMDPTIARGQRELMTNHDQSAIDAFGYTITATTPPPNDNFVNAQIITGTSGTVTGTNSFATKEPGEPNHEPLDNPGGRSVWYRWTAPSSGQAFLNTSGSNYDTLLAVYTGSSVNALTAVVKNDDVNPGVITTSIVQFSAISGTTYQIAVDGFDGDQGNISLNFTLPGAATPTPTPTPGPNTVQFTVSTANVTETPNATTKVDLQVTRTGNTIAAATVNYATSNATANDRSDYEAALGTLHFAAAETSKTIPVFIIDDAFGEGPETFNITLSNPVACTLGSPISVSITINSNESVNGANPVKDASFNTDFFVRQHYLDFFNREPDAGGLAFWKNQIDECVTQECREIRRINVSAAFFLSIEFQQTGYLVERLYKTAYGDTTATSVNGGTHQISVPIVRFNEFLADTQQIGRGVIIGQPGADQLLENNKQALIGEFVLRSRFTTAYPGSMTPAQFVDKLNQNAGFVLSQSERDQLVSELGSAVKTRAQVLRAVAEDADLFSAEQNRAFVLVQYFGYLRRNPDDSPEPTLDFSGYDFWLSKLNQFNGNFVNAEMVKAFIVSGEYQGRFGPP